MSPATASGRRSRTAQTLGTGVVVLAALALGTALQGHLQDPREVLGAPYERHGAVGEAVALRTMDLTVTTVRAAAQVRSDPTFDATTPGRWLLVDITYTPRTTTVTTPEPELLGSDGRRYGGRQGTPGTCTTAPVGVATSCTLVFEVPTEALEGLTLELPAAGDDPTADDLAVIDLGIDAARARAYAAEMGLVDLREKTS